MGVQMVLQDLNFNSLGYIPRNGIARSCGNSNFNFFINSYRYNTNRKSLYNFWLATIFQI